MIRLLLSASAAGALLLSGCGDPVGPPFDEAIALVLLRGSPDNPANLRLHVVGLESRASLGRSERLHERGGGRAAVSPDGRTLVSLGQDGRSLSGRRLVAMDTRTLRVVRRIPLADSSGYLTDRFGGLAIGGSNALALAPDNGRLFLCGEDPAGYTRLAAYAFPDMSLEWSTGRFQEGYCVIHEIPPGGVAPSGGLLFVGRRPGGQALAGWIVDPAALTIRDSVALPDSTGPAGNAVSDDGTALFQGSRDGRLWKIDLATGTVAATASVPITPWVLVPSPEGGVFVLDVARHTHPSSGKIWRLDRDLEPAGVIDLSGIRVPDYGGSGTNPPAIRAGRITDDGILLVATGIADLQLYAAQSAGVYFIDPATGAVLGEVRTDDRIGAVDILIP